VIQDWIRISQDVYYAQYATQAQQQIVEYKRANNIMKKHKNYINNNKRMFQQKH